MDPEKAKTAAPMVEENKHPSVSNFGLSLLPLVSKDTVVNTTANDKDPPEPTNETNEPSTTMEHGRIDKDTNPSSSSNNLAASTTTILEKPILADTSKTDNVGAAAIVSTTSTTTTADHPPQEKRPASLQDGTNGDAAVEEEGKPKDDTLEEVEEEVDLQDDSELDDDEDEAEEIDLMEEEESSERSSSPTNTTNMETSEQTLALTTDKVLDQSERTQLLPDAEEALTGQRKEDGDTPMETPQQQQDDLEKDHDPTEPALPNENNSNKTTEKETPDPNHQPKSPPALSSTSSSRGKRFSPWREPRSNLPPPAKDMIVDHTRVQKQAKAHDLEKRKARRMKRLLSDSIQVSIPMNVGRKADLGAALKRTREKRIQRFGMHLPNVPKSQPKNVSEHADDDDGNKEKDGEGQPPVRKKLKTVIKNVPQPHEYSSVIDYLEAKYTQGVMVDDGESQDGDQDQDEGGGSVYSETSFLDDTGLQRTVAEQVLGHTTTTKMELQDDDAFFVNVGDLEVEETELTDKQYDPLQDAPDAKKPRKRKKPDPSKATANGNESKTKESDKKKSQKETTASAKKKAKTNATDNGKKKAKKASGDAATSDKKDASDPAVRRMIEASKVEKAEVDSLYADLVGMIHGFTEKELPRRDPPKKTTMSVKVPDGMKPGDPYTFKNPYNPEQELRVKVPLTAKQGGSFRVTVPEKPDEEEEPTRDTNKLGRDFYDKLCDYADAWDGWCEAVETYKKAMGETYSAVMAKRGRFDKLATEFPKDLKTAVDKVYMGKILRRARQNRSKREKSKDDNEPNKKERTESMGSAADDGANGKTAKPSVEPATKKAASKPPSKKAAPAKKKRKIPLPAMATDFSTIVFDKVDFERSAT